MPNWKYNHSKQQRKVKGNCVGCFGNESFYFSEG